MRFVDTHVDRRERYAIGTDTATGGYYLSIPVANHLVEYEEYYAIDRAVHDGYPGNAADLADFAARCRRREHDDRLILPPGAHRGSG